MVVNSNGRMLTQRVNPELALVEVSLPKEALYTPWDTLPPDSALGRVKLSNFSCIKHFLYIKATYIYISYSYGYSSNFGIFICILIYIDVGICNVYRYGYGYACAYA